MDGDHGESEQCRDTFTASTPDGQKVNARDDLLAIDWRCVTRAKYLPVKMRLRQMIRGWLENDQFMWIPEGSIIEVCLDERCQVNGRVPALWAGNTAFFFGTVMIDKADIEYCVEPV